MLLMSLMSIVTMSVSVGLAVALLRQAGARR